MASWLKKQSFEEHGHACELASYIIKRGGKAKLDKIDVVPNDFGTPLEVFEQVYEHECRVSKMIDALVDVAAAEKDKASQDFLWGFVREQVEEEATASGIVDMVKKAGARLRATRMTSPDIRAGVALLIAAMSAEGVSTIQNIDQIDRGYKDIDGRLNALGARITRIDDCE